MSGKEWAEASRSAQLLASKVNGLEGVSYSPGVQSVH